jgi:hypothetical protein
MVKVSSEFALGWAVSFIESNGVIDLNDEYQPRIRVEHSDLKQLERLVTVFSVGRIVCNTILQDVTLRDWAVEGPQAFVVLERVIPYLSRMKEVAQLVANYWIYRPDDKGLRQADARIVATQSSDVRARINTMNAKLYENQKPTIRPLRKRCSLYSQ